MGTTLHKDLTGADLHINKLHADTHVAAGTDPLVLAESQVTDLVDDLADKVDEGDARLADARTPTAHTQTESTIVNLVSDLTGKAPTVHVHVKADITDFPAFVTGPAGPTGAMGADSTVPGPQGIQGETGVAGTDGAVGDTGAVGADGDAFVYADFTEGQLAALVGSQGIQGNAGATGQNGAAGATGSQGIQGEAGTDGATGSTGATGAAGADSTVAGPQGEQGIQGETGAAGTNTRPNLITNGDFETDTAGWSGGGATITRDTATPLVGTGSLKMTSAGDCAYAYKTCGATIGHQYLYSALVKSNAAAGRKVYCHIGNGGSANGASVDCSASAQTVSFTFTATATTAWPIIMFDSYVAGESFLADTVRCYDVTNAAATEVVYGSDTRLADARTPSAHTHLLAEGATDVTATAAELNQLDGVTLTGSNTGDQTMASLGLDADITTLALPANTTISPAGAELINDADAAAQRTTLGAEAVANKETSSIDTSMSKYPSNYVAFIALAVKVAGPASATDGHLAVFDAATGKLIKDGGAVPTTLPASDVSAWAKAGTKPAYASSEITNISVAGAALIDDADAAAQRATLGAVATGDARLSDARTPVAHNQALATISDVTATAAELNTLDGITATVTELNYTDGVTSGIQGQVDAKLPLAGGTLTGAVVAADHGTAATDQVVNVCYGTADPPTANTTTEGTLFIKYTA